MKKKTRIKREYTVYDETDKLIGTWYDPKSLQKDLGIKNSGKIYESINNESLIKPYANAAKLYRITLKKTTETYYVDNGAKTNHKYVKLPKEAVESAFVPGLYLTRSGKVFGTDACGIYEITPYLNKYKGVSRGYYKFHYAGHVRRLHYELARMFVPGYSPELVVDHKNEDSTDNRICNLHWVTRGQNTKKWWSQLSEEEYAAHKEIYRKGVQKSHETGRYNKHKKELSDILKARTGAKNPMARAIGKYSLDGALIEVYETIKAAAIANGTTPLTIIRAAKAERPGVGYIWKYAD